MLDGKYEITSQRELSPRETLFGATAPDGTAVQINWFELGGAADERDFERYRALLRALRRGGHAAIYDLVARPGAHYVAWRVPVDGSSTVSGDGGGAAEPIAALLEAYERNLTEAYICAPPGASPQVYALPFGSVLSGSDAPGGAHPAGYPVSLGKPVPGTVDNTLNKAVDNLWISRWQRLRPWALGSVLGLSGVLLLLLSAERQLTNRLVSVPEVRAQNINEALQSLYEAGFSTTPVPLTSARPAGEVLEVSPAVGTPLRPGRTLSVRYALPAGRSPERVPVVTAMTLARAETVLRDAGFSVGDVAHSYSDAEVGTVVSQAPFGDTLAARGGRVELLVSDGPKGESTLLPDLTGLSEEDALHLAEAAGFAREGVGLERTPGNGAASGTVLAQNITPFTEVPQGRARLRLTVAEGGASVAAESGTPDLTGLSLADAQVSARSAGLGVVTEATVSTSELPVGVVTQRPAPGAPLGGSVAVTLNVPPPRPTADEVPEETADRTAVRRARYSWQLGTDADGQRATVTVRLADGSNEVIVRGQRVRDGERLSGTYLTTATGPLTFTLTLDGEAYGGPLRVDPPPP